MLTPRRGLPALVAGTFLLLGLPAPGALASGAGGVEALPGTSAAPPAGGAEYGSALARVPRRPAVRALRLSRARVRAGRSARLALRVSRPGARTVRVRITLAAVAGGRTRHLPARRVRAGRTVRLRLPRTLRPGRYRVRVIALGARGERPVTRSGPLLRVLAEPKPRPKPKPRLNPQPPSGTPPTPVPPSLGGPRTASGVFPVQGAWSFGGADARFGAGRTGHTHEGQDIVAAAGIPVVAPLAGTVLFNDYQRGGAGRYVVLRADNGWDMFFAHCLAGSATVRAGARVAAGGRLCLVGSTGRSTGPHLHFEIWPDGWRHVKGTRPIDPLPQLRAWAR
jgi:murein DD-endopeptidase MepM/ murein hydrolase activator NlpD